MYKLRRYFLDTIGVPSNRFVNVDMAFTGIDGSPVDSLAMLRNGAGKTTQIALLLAQVLADRRDFLVSEDRSGRKRTLEALVQTGDTSHTACEWEDQHGNRLITGAVYEWKNKSRPKDFDKQGRHQLEQTWWCLRPDPHAGGADFDSLPFSTRTSGSVDMRGFVEHLRSLPAQGVDAVVSNQVKEWHETLRDRGFDPDLFGYFKQINGTEGGVEKLFARIDGPEAFVKFLLELVVETSRASDVRDLLADTAVEIAKRPTYETDRQFCVEALPLVEVLGQQHDANRDAVSARDDAVAGAARYKRQLIDTVAADDARALDADQQVSEISSHIREANREAEAARRQASEYRRVAAEMRLAAADRQVAYRTGVVERTETEQQAWTAVGQLISLRVEQDRLEHAKQALADATTKAKPLRDALTLCERRLVAVLNRTIADATARVEELDEFVALMEIEIAELDAASKEAVSTAARLRAERTKDQEDVRRYEERVGRAVEQGDLVERSEQPDDAHQRLTDELDTIATLVADLESKSTEAGSDLERHQRAHRTAEGLLADARLREASAQQHLGGLLRRVAAIGGERRLAALMQTNDFDPVSDAGDLVAQLETAIASADRAVINERVDDAEDGRAVASLSATRLLPPRRSVESVCDQLNDGGITAVPGWAYLAEHIPVDQHPTVLRSIPEVVDGVVVYGDPHVAAASIDDPPTDPVVIASATSFTNPGDGLHALVGPSPARHDKDAADRELVQRTEARNTREQAIERFLTQRRHDAELREQICALIGDVGPDGLDPYQSEVDVARGQVDARSTEIDEHLQAIEDTTAIIGDLASRASDTVARTARCNGSLRAVSELRRDFTEVVEPARTRLQSVNQRISDAEAKQLSTDEKIVEDRGQVTQWGERKTQLDAQVRGWDVTMAKFPGILPLDDTSADGLTVELAERSRQEADLHFRERFPEDTLRGAVNDSERRVAETSASFEEYETPAKDRARELLREPDAADPELRRQAAKRAAAEAGDEKVRLGVANAEQKLAKEEVAATHPPDGRPRFVEPQVQPTDEQHARTLANDANDLAGTHTRRVGYLEGERTTAATARDEAQRHKQLMIDMSDRFTIEPAEGSYGLIVEDEQITRDETGRIAALVDRAEKDVAATAEQMRKAGEAIRRWAQGERFTSFSEGDDGRAVKRVRSLILGESLYDRVAAHAAEFRDELSSRADRISQHIEQVNQTKANVVSRLVDVADGALNDLARVSALSALPEGIGPWAKHRFLIVEPVDGRPTHEQIHNRVSDVVEMLVASSEAKITLKPVELLQTATAAAVGPAGFRASILKPSPEQSTRHVPVDEMSLWSGGEVLTASLVLFCVMAKLRAENRSSNPRKTQAGVIPLDNPLGSANYREFLELQRLVAKANGAQLVFWTGLSETGAQAMFERIIPMRKRSSLTKPGHEYVTVDDEPAQSVTVVAAVHRDPLRHRSS